MHADTRGSRRPLGSIAWCVLSLALAHCGPGAASTDAAVDLDATVDGAVTEAAVDVYTGPVTARFALPRTGSHSDFTLPWPNDLALDANGAIDLSWLPNPRNNELVRSYVSLLAGKIKGFSPVAAHYFRFSHPVDPATLPTPADSRMSSGSVQLIDIDPMSPERGQRTPIQVYFRTNETRYWPANTLAVAPLWGFPLRPRTRYAIVVTDRVRGFGGTGVGRDADLTALVGAGGDDAVSRARAVYGPALDELARAGVDRARIASLSVFTTQDPVGQLFRAIQSIEATSPPRLLDDVRRTAMANEFSTFRGHYGPSPIFQQGTLPYNEAGSGGFVIDAMGNPQPQGMQNISFALTVPAGDMPRSGWPVVIYAHGTGGSASSFISDGTAASLAAQGVAVLGFDQIFNGERTVGAATGGTPEVQFFNFLNPIAGRTNNQQAAIDLAQAARLVRSLVLPASTPVQVAMGMPAQTIGTEIRFDPERFGFFGHSQGSLSGPLWLAAEGGATIAMFSGAGSTFNLAVTKKVEPVDIPTAVAVLLQIPSSNPEELVPLHPILTMLQTAIDVSDPVNYARYLVRDRREGVNPRNIYLTQGFVDHYAPPETAAAFALAMGLPLIDPVLHTVDGYDLSGVAGVSLPLTSNGPGGTTMGWQQFDARRNRDGHFVVFDNTDARTRVANFFGSWARSPERVAQLLPSR